VVADKPKLIVQAGAQLDDWGTPVDVLEFVRKVFDAEIAVDLASNAVANETVKAARYYSLERPCPDQPDVKHGELTFCNPPGPVENVRLFFQRWCRAVEVSKAGGFLCFNVDHFRSLECERPWFKVVMCRKRLKFVGAPSQYNHPSALIFAGRSHILDDFGTVLSWQ
jgi:hypothetical protein